MKAYLQKIIEINLLSTVYVIARIVTLNNIEV